MYTYIPFALGSALAYSTDTVATKLALEEMPFPLFMFILSFLYTILGVILFAVNGKEIVSYFKSKNIKPIGLAVAAIIIGTIFADFLMWKAISNSSRAQISTTIALIHLTPLFSLVLATLFFKQQSNWKIILGVVLTVIGSMILIVNTED